MTTAAASGGAGYELPGPCGSGGQVASTATLTRVGRTQGEHTVSDDDTGAIADEAAILGLVGDAIAERRTALGISQRDLATDSGVNRGLLRAVEHGTRRPSIITLVRITRALNTTPAKLLAKLR